MSDLREYFGNSPILGVDFPISDSSNETRQNFERSTRQDSKRRLIEFFKGNNFKGVKLDVLEYAPLLEKRLE
ncbi:16032_t:CDS:1, partial [Acaulospora colombiana]